MGKREDPTEDASWKTQWKQRRVLRALSLAATFGLAAFGITYGAIGMLPLQLMGGCPPRGDHVALVLSRTADGDGEAVTSAYYAVFDARTGVPLGRVSLDDASDSMDHAFCARADDERNWVVGFDDRPALHSNRSPEPLVPWSRIAASLQGVGEPRGLGWDDDRNQLVVNTSQGYALSIDPATLTGTRVPGAPSLSTLSGFHDDVVPHGVVEYYVGGRDELRLADATQLELEGHPRSRVTKGGAPLFAGRDFLMPAFVVHPATRSIEWPDPPSVVVVEETEMGSLTYRATRIALDGRVLWQFTPEEAAVASWRYRPIPWAAYAQGRMLVLFEASSMSGVDPSTGRRLWTTAYRAQP